jgi:uncharacterized protein YbjT (DUF2867 family)
MIVVTGATGNVGRPLVGALVKAGKEVIAVSRGDGPRGVRHARADLADPVGLRPVLAGAEALFLLVSGAGAHLDPEAIVDAARAGGVRRIVLLSSQAAVTRPGSVSHAPLRGIEEVVERSGLDWTHLRPTGFASNAFAWAPSVRADRSVAAPFGSVGLPIVDPLDIAEVAAAVLTGDGHAGTGEPVRFVEQTAAEARAQMLRFMPEPVVDGTLAIIGEPTEAERRVSPDVERLLGRKPYTFAEWVQRNVTAFR